jgi:mRNA interferase MazF
MNRGEVYLARLGPTEDSEQAGVRPVVIVSRDAINRSSPVVIVVPCTTWAEGRRLYPSQVPLRAPDGGLRADSLRRLERALLIALDLPGQFD